ncbi:MAG: threonine/serine exporter family protein [Marinifilaceae bacterium]|jgi:uncharacterized membrane protein YjjP (DUF1212 family)|nr:threonine/serine exporter family protein [Marinifilaceae bacterium]
MGYKYRKKRNKKAAKSNISQVPDKYKFIVILGKALHTYGVPSYKSQIYLNEIAAKKGIKASFMDTPTYINYVFYEENDHTYNYIECVPPGELNLGALSKVVEITKDVLNNSMGFAEARKAIERINNSSLGYGKFTELAAFIAASGGFCIILDAGISSSICASFMGALVYFITYLSGKSNYIKSTLECLVGFAATIFIGLSSLVFDNINISMTILASIIVFIPGLSLTTALEEITSRSLVSGTSKLADALVSLFKQFFGVALGLAVLPLFADIQQDEVINRIPSYIDFFAIIILALSLCPVFKIRPKHITFCVMAGFISFFTTSYLESTGIMISIFIGTLCAVISSKLFSKITKAPRLVFLVPGIIMLVPGSKAFIGLSSLFLDEHSFQTNMGIQIIYIFMGIIGGLIFSGSFIESRQSIISEICPPKGC